MSSVKTIYAGIRAVGIAEEDDRRDLFERVTGKRRLREMSTGEKSAVVEELRRLGFRDTRKSGKRLLDGPYAKKLQALWISAWNLGLVQSREDQALLAFVRRQTGIEHTRWIHDPVDAQAVVEALKGWLAREGGVMWGNSNGYDWLRDHVAKISWAQWCKLHPGANLRGHTLFRTAVFDVVGVRPSLDSLKTSDWHKVSNRFGIWIREAK